MYFKVAFSLILVLILLFIYWLATLFLAVAFGRVDLDGKPPTWASVTLIILLIVTWIIAIRKIFHDR